MGRTAKKHQNKGSRRPVNSGALERIVAYLEYVLIFVVIVECNSMYISAKLTDNTSGLRLTMYGLAIALTGLLILLHAAIKPSAGKRLLRYLPVWLTLLAFIGAFYLLNVSAVSRASRQSYLRNFVLLVPLLTLLFKIKQLRGEPLDLLYKHSDVTCVIAAASVVVYLSSIFHVDRLPSDAIYSTWSNLAVMHERVNLFNVCLFFPGEKWRTGDIALLRNFGFFTEPLMFSIPLITALATELFLRPRRDAMSPYRSLLLSAALVSSNATIGVILTVLLWIAKGFSWSVPAKKKGVTMLLTGALLGACVFLVLAKKLSSYEATEYAGNSFHDHIEDIVAGLRAFASKPLLGGGYRSGSYIIKYMSAEKAARNPGFSNSFAVVLGEGGIMLGALCMLPFFICFAYLFRKGDRRMGLWILGPMGLYACVVFIFRIYLMFLLAFGYALLDVKRVRGGRFSCRLGLADLHLDRAPRRANASSPEAGGERARAGRIALLSVVAAALFIWQGIPVYRALHAFLRTHQFSLSQSPTRALFLNIALLAHLACARDALARKSGWRCLGLLAWDAVYLAVYPRLYSDAVTLLADRGVADITVECAVLLAAYFVGALPVLWASPSRRRAGGVALACGAVACIAALCVAAQIRIGQLAAEAQALAPTLQTLTDASTGVVFADPMPSVCHRLNGDVSLSTTSISGYDAYDTVTVVCPTGSDRPELFEAGFQVAELSEEYLVYSNDPGVLAALGERGAAFHRYYAFPHAIELKTLAKKNKLKTRSGALVIGGGANSLVDGPYDTLHKGQYTADYALSVTLRKYKGCPDDTPVCQLRVTEGKGKTALAQIDVTLGMFDGEGNALVSVPFSLARISGNVLYQVIGEDGHAVKLRAIDVRQTPDFITVYTYNCHRNAVGEAYYYPDGSVYTQVGGYAMLRRSYNHADRVECLRYYDAGGQPFLENGTAFMQRYTYNRQGSITSEAYYDTNEQPIMTRYGFAKKEMAYDAYGHQTAERYLDTQGRLTVGLLGYAELRQTYSRDALLLETYYFGADGSRITPPVGYSGIRYGYDGDKRLTSVAYLDEADRPVCAIDGVAEIHYAYDGMGRVVREDFFDASGAEARNTSGYAARQLAYDSYGNVNVEIYFDESGRRTPVSAGFAEVRRVFNEKKQIVQERYYGVDSQPVTHIEGCYGYLKAYTDNGDLQKTVCIDADGQPMLNAKGYAALLLSYDERRNCTDQLFLDVEGRPTLMAAGICEIRSEYDDRDLNIRDTFYDTDGKPAANAAGIAEVRREYDAQGKLVGEFYFDLAGTPVTAGA